MSAHTIHDMAQSDTPSAVHVPYNMQGLLLWAIGKWGGAAIVALALLFGLQTVYQDLRTTNQVLLATLQDNARTNAQFIATLEAIKIELRSAHERVSRP